MTYLKFILFVLLIFGIYGCKTVQVEESQSGNFRQDKLWQYFELEKAIKVKIINHLPSQALCGTFAFASITIVETENGEKIRILDLCNLSNYKENETVEVLPAKKPEFNVMLPNRILKNPKNNQNELFEVDSQILRTAYGKLPNR